MEDDLSTYFVPFDRVSLTPKGLILHRGPLKESIFIPDGAVTPLLIFLRTPQTIASLLDRFPEYDSNALASLLRSLEAGGVCTRSQGSFEHQASNIPAPSVDLVTAVYSAAYEISKYADGSAGVLTIKPDEALRSFGASMMQAVESLEAALMHARDVTERSDAEACSRLGNLTQTPVNIIIGGGVSSIPGWINIDLCSPEAPFDMRRPLPLPEGCAAYVYNAFVLEHLYYPNEASQFVREIYRLLVLGGTARFVLPDAAQIISRYLDGDKHLLRSKWLAPAAQFTPLASMLFYLGAAPNANPSVMSHKFAYDFETLRSLCSSVGFSHVTRSRYMQSTSVALNIDSQSTAYQALSREGFSALFVDATK